MRFASDLLYRMLRATGSGDAFPASQDLELPPVLIPFITVPGPISRGAGFTGAAVQRESFTTSLGVTNAGVAAAFTQTIATFGRGLWEVGVRLAYGANFTTVFDGNAVLMTVLLRDPSAGDRVFLQTFAVTAFPQNVGVRGHYLFEDDGWSLIASVGATAAGQAHQGQFMVLASRLN